MKIIRRNKGIYLLAAFLLFVLCLGPVQKLQAASKSKSSKVSYTIYVNRQTNIVNVVNSKTKAVVRAMYCSTGKNNRTITGTFRTKEKMKWHALNGGVYGQYCTRISGPYLFHSVPYTTTKKTKVETEEYNKLGKQASLGCVRLAVVDAKWIYDHCKRGTKVVINDSCSLQKPTRNLLKISTSSKTGWDPTDPSAKNPYHPAIALTDPSYAYVKAGSIFNPLAVISVASSFTDANTLLANVSVSGTVNTAVPGTYKVVYTVKDPATELSKKLTVKFTVVQ